MRAAPPTVARGYGWVAGVSAVPVNGPGEDSSAGAWTYEGAKRALKHILASPAFQSPQPAQPWWWVAWRWVRAHLPLSLLPGHGRAAVWAACLAVLLAALVLLVLWRMRNTGGAEVRPAELSAAASSLSQSLDLARRSLRAGDDRALLAHLLEACLVWAADRGWVHAAKHKTARRYRLELARAAAPNPPDPAFVALFAELVEAAEAVRFAGRRLDRTRLELLCERVRRWTEGGGP